MIDQGVKLIRGFSAFQEKKFIPWQWINSKNILKGRSKWFCCLARFASISRGYSQRANTCLWNEVDCLRYQVFSKTFPTEKHQKNNSLSLLSRDISLYMKSYHPTVYFRKKVKIFPTRLLNQFAYYLLPPPETVFFLDMKK